MFTKADRSKFSYWFAHWCAYNMTALNLGAWKVKYLFHDIEKPWLRLFLPYKKVQKIHRRSHPHHPEWLEERLKRGLNVEKLLKRYDFQGTIIDWECSRFTKKESPRTAKEEYNLLLFYDSFKEKYPYITKIIYNEFSRGLGEAIKELNLEV